MKKVFKVLLVIFAMIITIALLINLHVRMSTSNQILEEKDYANLSDIDCIIILGAGVWGDKPSPMLMDRLLKGISLYNNNVSTKIIMSGDHGRKEYDEVNIMKDYAINKGIPSENIFMDHAGFSTYESIYRAKEIFQAKRIVIVTQEYHLYRALYIANKLGLDAYGVSANYREYAGQTYRELREILARDKDFVKSILKPKPTYLGEVIPVSGNGDVTNDEKDSLTCIKEDDTYSSDKYKLNVRWVFKWNKYGISKLTHSIILVSDGKEIDRNVLDQFKHIWNDSDITTEGYNIVSSRNLNLDTSLIHLSLNKDMSKEEVINVLDEYDCE